VSTPDVAPTAFIDAIQSLTLRFVGAKDAGSDEWQLVPFFVSQPTQFWRVQPGSPSWK